MGDSKRFSLYLSAGLNLLDQPFIDVLTTFPNKGAVGTQVKCEDFLNHKTNKPTKTETSKKSETFDNFKLFAEQNFVSYVVEFATEKSVPEKFELEDYESIISAGNWEECMGPVLGQVAKTLREPFLKRVRRLLYINLLPSWEHLLVSLMK